LIRIDIQVELNIASESYVNSSVYRVLLKDFIQEALTKGVECHKAGQLDLAKKLYASVIELEPRHPDANHNIGVIEMDTGNIPAAVPLLKIALEEGPENAQYWISYIDALIRHEAIDEARQMLALARTRGAEGKVFGYLEEKLNELNPNVADMITDKGLNHPVNKVSENQKPRQNQLQPIINLYNQGQLQQTSDAISKLQQQFPNSATLYNIIGAANAGLGKSDSAKEAFNSALAIKPDNAQTFYNIGKALQGQGKLDEAIEA
jgi:Flp pilus assembly protein TadD